MCNRLQPLWATLILLFLPLVAHADTLSDTDKEKRWADQIVDFLIDGEAVWLESAGHRFLAIHTPAGKEPLEGSVLLVHGTGAHPNWPQVIAPLRSGLSEAGWQSLSLQMPLPPEGVDEAGQAALIREGSARLQAGLDWLEHQGVPGNISLISHSRGGADVLYFAATHEAAGVASIVTVGVNGVFANLPAEINTLASLQKISIPVLDLYGQEDLKGILETAPQRKKTAGEAGNTGYRQIMIPGADHFFDGEENALLEEITRWLLIYSSKE